MRIGIHPFIMPASTVACWAALTRIALTHVRPTTDLRQAGARLEGVVLGQTGAQQRRGRLASSHAPADRIRGHGEVTAATGEGHAQRGGSE